MNEDVKSTFIDKHPQGADIDHSVLISEPLPEPINPVVFDPLDGHTIKRCVLKTEGASGVSQGDDHLWHKMVTYFKHTSADLCDAMAGVARRISTEFVDPQCLSALTANLGIALDKCPAPSVLVRS